MLVSGWIIYKEKGVNRELWYIIGLLLATWTYPLYTLGFKLIPGLVGNVLYNVLTIFIINQVKLSSGVASYLLYPVVLWVTFATVYVISVIKECRNGIQRYLLLSQTQRTRSDNYFIRFFREGTRIHCQRSVPSNEI